MKRKSFMPKLSFALAAGILMSVLLLDFSPADAGPSGSCTLAYDAAYNSCISQSNGDCYDECYCTLQGEVAECACLYGTTTQAFRTCRNQAFQRIVACEQACDWQELEPYFQPIQP